MALEMVLEIREGLQEAVLDSSRGYRGPGSGAAGPLGLVVGQWRGRNEE